MDEIRNSGYFVSRAVLDQATIDCLRVAFDAEGSGHTEHVEINTSTPHAERWLSLARTEPVHTIVAELIGHALETRVHGRSPLLGGGQQGLHADRPARRSNGRIEAVTALWMLDDFTIDNGATRLVPGSHHAGQAVPRHYAQPHHRHPDEIVITGSAGDVLLFDAHLWHSGRRNTSGAPRRSVQMTCTSAAATTSLYR